MASKIIEVRKGGKFEECLYTISKEEASRMVRDGIAAWIPRTGAVEIIQAMHFDGKVSSKPLKHATERYAAGCKVARAAIDERRWKPIVNTVVKDRSMRVVPPAYGALRLTGSDAVFPISTDEWRAIDEWRPIKNLRDIGWDAPSNMSAEQLRKLSNT